jgi:Fe-S-cluster containining protein
MLPEQQKEWERGLRFAHMMMQVTQIQGNEALASIMALTDLMVEKGVATEEEIVDARERARKHVSELQQPQVRFSDMGDKYADVETVEIDCAARLHLCHARCCTFAFYLTAQDLDEGVARWDYGNPYWIKRRSDGYCTHCDPQTKFCTIHERRPHVCRLYDCRNDKRIWIDFEQRIPAPLEPVVPPLPIAMAERAATRSTQTRTPQARRADGEARAGETPGPAAGSESPPRGD